MASSQEDKVYVNISEWLKEDLRDESSNNRKNDFEMENAKEKDLEKSDIADNIIDSANQYFLLKILSPEITKNEDKKREHKDILINLVKIFLAFQFFIVTVLVLGTIIMVFVFHGVGKELDLSYINTIVKLISVYITSVVAELIAMLNYIVSKVFDTSITGLVELYKDKTKE